MKTPYQILDVARDASNVEIKQAYLCKVKNNPPDRDQKKFQLINSAFETIKDHKSRVSHDLFTLPSANFNELVDLSFSTKLLEPLTPENFKQLLQAGIDESTFQHCIAKPKKS